MSVLESSLRQRADRRFDVHPHGVCVPVGRPERPDRSFARRPSRTAASSDPRCPRRRPSRAAPHVKSLASMARISTARWFMVLAGGFERHGEATAGPRSVCQPHHELSGGLGGDGRWRGRDRAAARARPVAADLAVHSGVSSATLQALRAGTSPGFRTQTLARISEALEWPPNALLAVREGAAPTGLPT